MSPPDQMPETGPSQFVIAIDGPAASGKSSTSQWVAQRLGIRHVDSGALYRAATAAALRVEPDADRWTPEGVLAAASSIQLVPTDRTFAALLDGQDCDEELRSTAVTSQVSRVARMQPVREWVNARVREAAREHAVVVDGRDIGTAVFPDAALKIFLVADPWERAKRRLVQRLERLPSDGEVAEETERLVQRDAKDSQQTVQAADAVLIDSTYLTQAEQVDRIESLARAVSRNTDGSSEVDGGGWKRYF
ncbi:MAG: Cytidylate kinase [Gemmatimonadetes bacterium]|nr:Cytidylate kinase [Gemmatimonadota bacterium]